MRRLLFFMDLQLKKESTFFYFQVSLYWKCVFAQALFITQDLKIFLCKYLWLVLHDSLSASGAKIHVPFFVVLDFWQEIIGKQAWMKVWGSLALCSFNPSLFLEPPPPFPQEYSTHISMNKLLPFLLLPITTGLYLEWIDSSFTQAPHIIETTGRKAIHDLELVPRVAIDPEPGCSEERWVRGLADSRLARIVNIYICCHFVFVSSVRKSHSMEAMDCSIFEVEEDGG